MVDGSIATPFGREAVKMPIKRPVVTEMDMQRARQIVCSLIPLKRLSDDDAEIVARAIAERLDYQQGKADALNTLGIVYYLKGNLQLSLRYYNDAYNHYKAIHDTSNVVQTLMNIGIVFSATR